MQFSEAQQGLCRKLNIDYTDLAAGLNGLFVIADIKDYINNAQKIAWDIHRWDFTEANKAITTTVSTDYYDYPTEMVSGSAEFLTVAGLKYTKIDFEDYLNWKTDNPTSTDKYWAERGRLIFVNSLAYTAGQEMVVFGKALMPSALVNDADLLMFSPDSDNVEHSGNNAIVQLAYSEALASEKKRNPAQAKMERDNAIQILESIWKPMAEDRAKAQNKGRTFFDVPDFFQSNMGSEDIGNF